MGDSLDSYMSISTLQMQHLEGQLSADINCRSGVHILSYENQEFIFVRQPRMARKVLQMVGAPLSVVP
jgi:hypothetical protein